MENPVLDIFSEALEDTSIDSVEYHPYSPNDVGVPGITKNRFEIQHKDQDSYINYARSYLEVKCKIVGANGADLNGNELLALQNNGYSLFERGQLLIDNQVIEEVQHPGVASSIMALAGWSSDYANTSGSNMNWFQDSGTGTPVLADNVGFASRNLLHRNSQQITLYMPLKHCFGYCADVDKVTKGLRFSLVLNKNQAGNIIHAGAGSPANAQVYINKIQLWVATVKPSLEQVVRLENALARGYTQKLNWRGRSMYRSPSFQEATPSYRITTNITQPTSVFVGIQATATDGDQTANNQIFLSNGLTSAELRVNNVQYPREKLTMDFAPGSVDTGRMFQMFQEYKSKFHDNENGSLVHLVDYTNAFPIIHFNLQNVEKSVFNINGGCDLEFRCRQSNGTAVQFYVLVVHEKEAVAHSNGSQIRLEQL
jgi:hypothetical protein